MILLTNPGLIAAFNPPTVRLAFEDDPLHDACDQRSAEIALYALARRDAGADAEGLRCSRQHVIGSRLQMMGRRAAPNRQAARQATADSAERVCSVEDRSAAPWSISRKLEDQVHIALVLAFDARQEHGRWIAFRFIPEHGSPERRIAPGSR